MPTSKVPFVGSHLTNCERISFASTRQSQNNASGFFTSSLNDNIDLKTFDHVTKFYNPPFLNDLSVSAADMCDLKTPWRREIIVPAQALLTFIMCCSSSSLHSSTPQNESGPCLQLYMRSWTKIEPFAAGSPSLTYNQSVHIAQLPFCRFAFRLRFYRTHLKARCEFTELHRLMPM